MGAILTLVRPTVSQETVDALKDLLHAAERGEVVGIAFTAMLRRDDWYADAVGEARRIPVLTRGMLLELSDAISPHKREN